MKTRKTENVFISSKNIMPTKEILQSHPVSVLRKEISKTNIKGYSKMKKDEVIELMLKAENKEKFKHIKMAEKKQRVKAEPKGTHKMPDGTVMTGAVHSKNSKPVKAEPKKAEPKKEDEKEFSKNWLLKFNDYVKRKGSDGRIYSAGSNKGYVLVNELDSLRDPKFINEMNQLIGKDQTPNIIVNANNFKTQMIKALYLDSIENRGMYKMVMKQVNKFISNVKKVRFQALKRKKAEPKKEEPKKEAPKKEAPKKRTEAMLKKAREDFKRETDELRTKTFNIILKEDKDLLLKPSEFNDPKKMKQMKKLYRQLFETYKKSKMDLLDKYLFSKNRYKEQAQSDFNFFIRQAKKGKKQI